MAKKKESGTGTPLNMQLMGIEIYSLHLSKDVTPGEGIILGFQIGIRHAFFVDEDKLLVSVDVWVKNDESDEKICSLGTAIDYRVAKLESILIKDKEGNPRLPDQLLTYINATSIATVRGVLFMAFRGTRLESIVMPLIDMSVVTEAANAL